MNLFQLLSEKNIGLIDAQSGERIRWYESSADEAGLLDMDDDGNVPDDYGCLGLTGFIDGVVHYFRTEADVSVVDEYHVTITSESQKDFMFSLYRQVLTNELAS